MALNRFCVIGKTVKRKQVLVGDGTGRYRSLISVFANLFQLSTKDLLVSIVKKKKIIVLKNL